MYDQEKREIERADRMRHLLRLAETDQVRCYFATYADYLEWDGVISNQRAALVKMLRQAVSQLGAAEVLT